MLYTLIRILFYAYYADFFAEVSLGQLLKISVHGLRFDLSAIFYVNALFILLHLLPLPIRAAKGYQKLLQGLFYLTNIIALTFMFADFEYFQFIHKRSDSAIFSYGFDLWKLLPQLLTDFWYLPFIGVLLIFLLHKSYQATNPKTAEQWQFKPHIPTQVVLFVLGIGLTILAMRGGLQLKPIKPITAAQYVPVSQIALLINTPFNIIHSWQRKHLQVPNYLSDNDLAANFNIRHSGKMIFGSDKENQTPPNVVLIIVESLSKEYTGLGYLHDPSYTPFLDSLMEQSLTFTNAYANGRQSNQGIPAILAGIPVLMADPYIVSSYQSNRVEGIGNLLKKMDYTTAFFHGANNGSFNFDGFTKAVGFDAYYGRNEYANDEDFDGNWGIFDEPFLQFTATKMNELKEPFLAGIFTLSSHHPYTLPDDNNNFPEGEIPIHKTIGYADDALNHFFDAAKEMPWYNNTLFIITADHTGPTNADYESARIAGYAVPVLFFKPDSTYNGLTFEQPFQHSDLLPTILDYTNYPNSYTAFGQSAYKTKNPHRYVYSYLENVYQIMDEKYLLFFDGTKTVGFYIYRNDPLLEINLMGQLPVDQMRLETQLKAIIQTHHQTLVGNGLVE